MFGVITLKAVHPCLNMPRIKRTGRASYKPVGEGGLSILPALYVSVLNEITGFEVSHVSSKHSLRGCCVLFFLCFHMLNLHLSQFRPLSHLFLFFHLLLVKCMQSLNKL